MFLFFPKAVKGTPLAAGDDMQNDEPQESDPLDKYLLKDTADFKIARDAGGKPILWSSVEAAGGLPLLYGADGHGRLVLASSDYNFSTQAVPAGPADKVKASDLGGNFETPRSAPQAANPPTPPVTTSLSYPSHRPIVIEHSHTGYHREGHSHHGHSHGHSGYSHGHSGHAHGHSLHSHPSSFPNYEHWSSEQKPVTAEAPENAQWAALGENQPAGAGAPLADLPQHFEQREQRPVGPEGPAGAYTAAPSSKFEYDAPQPTPSSPPSGTRGPWESAPSSPPSGGRGPWESAAAAPQTPEGAYWNEQAFLGQSRARPTQG